MDPFTAMLLAGGGSLLKYFLGGQANDKMAGRQFAALDQAQGAIQGAADKAMGYQEPYLKNAGADYNQLRNLVQSGFFQQPYGKSFQSQSFQGPSFGFNPSQGNAAFASWQPQGGPASFTPQALPQMPKFAQQPAPAQAQGPQPMTRSNDGLVEKIISDALQSGMRSDARNLGENPLQRHSGQPQHPIEAIKETYNPYRPSNQPPTMKDLMAANNTNQPGSLPYRGSGPFMPTFNRGLPGPMRR